MDNVLGVARRRFVRDLERRLVEPNARILLCGVDADILGDALLLAWPQAIQISACRVPFGWMHALAARLGITLGGSRAQLHRQLRAAWASQSQLIVVRDARRLDAESRLWLDSLVGLEGPAVLVIDEHLRPLNGYSMATVPRLDADAVAEWCARPEVLRRLVHASEGSARVLDERLVAGTPVAPELSAAADYIAAADGLTPDELFELHGVQASDEEWARAGVYRVRGELRTSQPASASSQLERAQWCWEQGQTLEAMRLWDDPQHVDLALERLQDAPACGAELLASSKEPRHLSLRVQLLRQIGLWGVAVRAAETWHQHAPSDASAYALATLLLHTGRASAALTLVPEASEVRWRVLRAEARYQCGELADAAAEIETLLDVDCAELHLDALQTWSKLAVGDDAESLRRYDAYREAASMSPRHLAYATSGRGVALIRMRQVDDAIETLLEGARLAELADDVKARALAHHNLGVALHLQDRYTEARAAYETALRWLRALGHTSSMARCAYNLGELYEQLGAHERALKMGDLGAQLGGTEATPASKAEGALLRARALLALDRLDAAKAALQSVQQHLLDVSRRAGCEILLARIDTAAGRSEAALERLAQIQRDLPASRRAELEIARARALRAFHGPLGREFDAAQQAVLDARESGSLHWQLEALRVWIDALRAQGHATDKATEEAHRLENKLASAVPNDLVGVFQARRPATPSADIIGRSKRLHEALDLARRVAPTRCTVLLRGESGTGKELLAEAIHRASGRRTKPLVRVSCAALVESLLLSELFGHERGAFTGATERRQGRFELANGGTLFLDEVGELSLQVQAALLRVLQDRTFERVGGSEPITVDVRVIAATHRDLEAMVAQGSFRADLYYRLNEVGLTLPPLRERREDVPLLVDHVLRRLAREQRLEPKAVSADAMQRLQRFSWPGNVRQLENIVQSAALFGVGPVLGPADFTLPKVATSGDSSDHYARLARGEISMRDLKKELERACVRQALEDCDGNITKAAELLGMKRPRVSQLVKEYGLRDDE